MAKKSNFISSKLLIVEDLSITQNDRNTQVSIVDLCKNRFWTTGSSILGEKGTKSGTKVQFSPNSISPEQMVVQRWFNAHFNRNTHFPISVSYHASKMAKKGNKGAKSYINQTVEMKWKSQNFSTTFLTI